MQIILMQRQELICSRNLQVLETSVRNVSAAFVSTVGWRGIGRIHQRETHLISGQLEWWRASNKIQIYYFNFVMLLTVSESETSGFLFWGPSSEMEDKAYPPWLHQNSNPCAGRGFGIMLGICKGNLLVSPIIMTLLDTGGSG